VAEEGKRIYRVPAMRTTVADVRTILRRGAVGVPKFSPIPKGIASCTLLFKQGLLTQTGSKRT